MIAKKIAGFKRSILFFTLFIKKAADIPVTNANIKSEIVVVGKRKRDIDRIIIIKMLS